MTRPNHAHHVVTTGLSVAVIALSLTVGLPHRHDGSSAANPAHACRVCKMQEGFAATPSLPQACSQAPVVVAVSIRPAVESPRAIRLARCAIPRAPPTFSS